MGIGKVVHEKVINYLENKYGPGKYRYYDKWGTGKRYSYDYLGGSDNCNAIVEVCTAGDEWRTIAGKVVTYLYAVKQKQADKLRQILDAGEWVE